MSDIDLSELKEVEKNNVWYTLLNFFILMRPKQWIKNLFLFAGILFSGNLFNLYMFERVIYALLAFCLASSSIYITNDIFDVEKDRLHPQKKNRPIAAGKVGMVPAVVVAIFLVFGAVLISYNLSLGFLIVLTVYVLESFFYSMLLKEVLIIELFIVSLGFVLRAIAGVVVINQSISPWLLVCTYLLALFIILNKRRHELIVLKNEAGYHRMILKEYSISLLDNMTSVVTSATVVTYSLYTFTSEHKQYLMVTIPFVLYGIFRYLYIIDKKDLAGNPENIVFKDKPMLINLFLWVLSSVIIIYFF